MLEKIAIWLMKILLEFLLSESIAAFNKKTEEIREEQKRGEINEENAKKYEAAADRVSRIREAVNLLNRTP